MKVRHSKVRKHNTYCGPSALSLITGKTAEACADDVRKHRSPPGYPKGPPVKSMTMSELRGAIFRGRKQFAHWVYVPGVRTRGVGPTVAAWLKTRQHINDIYVVITTSHFIVVKGRKIYDNKNPEGVFLRQYKGRRARVESACIVRRR